MAGYPAKSAGTQTPRSHGATMPRQRLSDLFAGEVDVGERVVREEAAAGRVAFGGAVDELPAEFHDAGAAQKAFFAGAAEEIGFHFHGDGAFVYADARGDCQPHGHVCGGDEDDAADDAVGAGEFRAIGSADDAGAAGCGYDAKAIETVERRGSQELLECFLGRCWRHSIDSLCAHGTLREEKIERRGDVGLELAARDHGIEEPVLEKEFGALETFRQFLPDGLLNHAGAGKADERAGFGDIQVAEHRVTGGDAAGGGIGEHGDVGEPGIVESGERAGNFGELHQADGALHHARAAGAGDDDERELSGDCALDGAGDLFTDDGAHRAADEAELHGAAEEGTAGEFSLGGDHRVVDAELLPGFAQALPVGARVGEMERVSGSQRGVMLGPAGVVEEQLEALGGAELEVVVALRADVPVRFQVLAPDDLAASGTLLPHALGADTALLGRDGGLDGIFVAFEPSHRKPKGETRNSNNGKSRSAPSRTTRPNATSIVYPALG